MSFRIRTATLCAPAMPKSYKEIDCVVQEIFEMVRRSGAPLSLLGMKVATLVGNEKWSMDDAERVSGRVIELLVERRGWKRLCQVAVEGEL
jgi:hypothetical protein